MNYYKKTCILRQIKQGFSGDGKPLSGLVKAEQYGKNLAVEVSIINFAPLAVGEYYCLLSDGQNKTEMLALRGKSLFNLLTDLDISRGFCAVICHAKTEIVPIAYGVNGNGSYDWKRILHATLPPVFPNSERENAVTETPIQAPNNAENTQEDFRYDDENLASENYYRENQDYERIGISEVAENARAQSGTEIENAEKGLNTEKNDDTARVLHAFTTESDGYYRAVKGEIDKLFSTHPRDDTLSSAFRCSEWIRVKGSKDDPEYLVGVVYESGKAKYICYALAARQDTPPQEIAEICSTVPASPFLDARKFFVIFQSAATGECIRPPRS